MLPHRQYVSIVRRASTTSSATAIQRIRLSVRTEELYGPHPALRATLSRSRGRGTLELLTREGAGWGASLSLEIRRPLLQERLHPLFGVVARAEQTEERGLQELSFRGRHVAAAHHRFDRRPHGQRSPAHDLARHLFGGCHQLIGGDDLVDQTDALRLRGADAVPGADQLQCFSFAEQTRHSLRAAVAGDDSQRHLRQSELRLLRSDADVAGQRKLASPAEGESVDGGDDRLGKALDEREDELSAL